VKRTYQVAAIVFLLIAAFLLRESLALRYLTRVGPGPGFFAVWNSIFMGLLAATMLYHATFRQSPPMLEGFLPARAGVLRIAAIVAALLAATVLLPPLGFRLTMLGFVVIVLLAMGKRNPLVTAAVAVACSFGTYQLFVEWLDVMLPVGMLGI